jgi:hypothetical protein
MKKLHSFIKHLVAILLGTALVGMSVYAVQIPTSLNNALQYIMETIWTSDGTASGTVNVDISTWGIYIRTGFLSNGNSWNNMSLGLDTSGNVVYVPGSSSTPIFSLASNFIPKLDSLGSALEISVMYQSGWLIWVNKTNPTRSVNILWDFLVETQGLNVTYQYNFVNSNTGLWYPPVDIGTAPRCTCDVNANAADCSSPSFASVNDQGFYCVDLTIQNNGNYYDHNVYTRQTIGIPSPVLSTSGANVWVRTNNPQAALDVSGNVMIHTTPAWLNSWDVLTINPTTKEVSTRSAGSFLGGTATWYSLVSVWWGTSLLAASIISPWSVLWNAKSLIAWPWISLSSSISTVTISALWWSSNGWNLTGNAGTNPATNFVGTTDNQWLSMRVNNTEIHRYYPNGSMIWGFSHTYNNGSYAIIAWGSGNTLSWDYAVVWWGGMNYALWYASTVWGWFANAATWTTSTIAGWVSNYVPSDESFIWGWSMNAARGYRSTIWWGRGNETTGDYSSILWWLNNIAAFDYSFVGWWLNNVVNSIQSSIIWGSNNRILVNSNGSVIVWGSGNTIDGQFGSNIFIGWGNNNTGSRTLAVVVWWSNNQATQNSFVGWGIGNRAIGNPILFGPSNVVVWGNFNTAQWIAWFVWGWVWNVTLGSRSTVPGGYQNTGAWDYSFAAGQNANAAHNDSFVWNATWSILSTTSWWQFLIWAYGGVGINSPIRGYTAIGKPADLSLWMDGLIVTPAPCSNGLWCGLGMAVMCNDADDEWKIWYQYNQWTANGTFYGCANVAWVLTAMPLN